MIKGSEPQKRRLFVNSLMLKFHRKVYLTRLASYPRQVSYWSLSIEMKIRQHFILKKTWVIRKKYHIDYVLTVIWVIFTWADFGILPTLESKNTDHDCREIFFFSKFWFLTKNASFLFSVQKISEKCHELNMGVCCREQMLSTIRFFFV